MHERRRRHAHLQVDNIDAAGVVYPLSDGCYQFPSCGNPNRPELCCLADGGIVPLTGSDLEVCLNGFGVCKTLVETPMDGGMPTYTCNRFGGVGAGGGTSGAGASSSTATGSAGGG